MADDNIWDMMDEKNTANKTNKKKAAQKNIFEQEQSVPQKSTYKKQTQKKDKTLNLFDIDPPKEPDVWDLFEENVQEEKNADVWDLAGVSKSSSSKESAKNKNPKQNKRSKANKQLNTEKEVKPKKEKKKKSVKKRILQWGIGSVAALLIVFVSYSAIMIHNTTQNDDLWLNLAQVPYRDYTILYAEDSAGNTIEYARLNSTQNKEYVSSGDIPQNLKNAFVAVEDKNFYKHNGVSITRTAYAVLNEVKHSITGSYIGGSSGQKQGASTIDQQLVKNLTKDDDNSNLAGYTRKIREIYRAYKLDSDYSKDEILTAYLNVISFTGNTAGVQAEAQKLFGKDVNQLTLSECAGIAAITRNPANYNPVKKPENYLNRRNYVLQLMLEQEMISQSEYDEAVAEPVELNYSGEPDLTQPVTTYFTDVVIDETIQQFVDERGLTRAEASDLLYNGGLRIYTTVVPQLQQAMENALGPNNAYPKPGVQVEKKQYNEDGTAAVDESGNAVYATETVYPQAAMISLDYDGGICAVVGGLGEKEVSRGFNRATSAVRQVGSTMKPIGPYAVALERNKITWSTPFLDAPVKNIEDEATGVEKEWPVNATNTYTQKDMLVVNAFAQSVNTVAVRVGEVAGIGNMYNFVHNKLEVTSLTKDDKDYGPLVLGSSTYGITPLEMTRAYTIFGNGGTLPTVHSFSHIENGVGDVWLQVELTNKSVLSEDTSFVMNRLMKKVLESGGTASGMAVQDDIESVGKTGTTSDHRDHWFVGLTPYYVTASWYGYDENIALGADSHWSPPVVAWRTVMQNGQKGLAAASFSQPSTVITAKYCTVTGDLAGQNCPSAVGYYKEGELPRKVCTLHG